ncbi:hypothetical protein ACKI1J_01560 [Streptomyces scabiei]|uniref:hypothetical protein n=1 Tax=Streptomyces scabiei TaxID=1930 RepID=UPI0038F5FBAD
MARRRPCRSDRHQLPPTRPSLVLPGSRLGLVGPRERADILRGTLESGPAREGGYRARLPVPLSTD